MDEDSIKAIAKEYADGCQLSRGNVIARLAIEHAFISGTRLILSDVPTEQLPSAENRCPECGSTNLTQIKDEPQPLGPFWFCNTCRSMFSDAVKAVAADTNEECETASQAHTVTKD